MLRRAVARLNTAVDDVIRRTLGAPPPLAPAMALAAPSASDASSAPHAAAALGSWTVADMAEQMRTLWGVPKYRTSHRES